MLTSHSYSEMRESLWRSFALIAQAPGNIHCEGFAQIQALRSRRPDEGWLYLAFLVDLFRREIVG